MFCVFDQNDRLVTISKSLWEATQVAKVRSLSGKVYTVTDHLDTWEVRYHRGQDFSCMIKAA